MVYLWAINISIVRVGVWPVKESQKKPIQHEGLEQLGLTYWSVGNQLFWEFAMKLSGARTSPPVPGEPANFELWRFPGPLGGPRYLQAS